MKKTKNGILLALVAVISIVIGFILSADFTGHTPAEADSTVTTSSKTISPSMSSAQNLSEAFIKVAKDVKPAVVNISTEKVIKAYNSDNYRNYFDFFNDPFLRKFFEMPRQPREREYTEKSLGSGVIISSDGYIITNNHVVANADKIKVKLADGRVFEAENIKGKKYLADPKTDVAVLKIKGKDLPYVKLGNSDKIKVGEWVLTIGAPFGFSQTVTAGIISAKGRSKVGITDYEDFIQTDAAINPGNSGGPMVNLNGEVIGINTAIISRAGGNLGIGFAVPINIAKKITNDLIKRGKVVRGWLGVVVQDVDNDLAKSFKLKNVSGVLVSDVDEAGPAQKAGIKRGDVIVEFDGQTPKNIGELRTFVANTEIGKVVNVVIIRKGKKLSLKVKIKAQPKKMAGAVVSEDKLGLVVRDLSNSDRKKLNYKGNGVVIDTVKPNSPAAQSNLKKGDVIVEVNQHPIKNADDYGRIISSVKGNSVLLLILRGEYTIYMVVPLK